MSVRRCRQRARIASCRGVKAGPQATAQAARSGLYASERFHTWKWFDFERTRRHSNHGQAGFCGAMERKTGLSKWPILYRIVAAQFRRFGLAH